MQTQQRLLVVIINYKTPILVCDAIESVIPEIDLLQDSIVVVDNDSQDNSVEDIQTFINNKNWNANVNVVKSSKNGGFSYGNNVGIKTSKAEFYLLLNSDAYLHKNSIKAMIDTFTEQSMTGIVGPRIEWPNGGQQVSCFNNTTIWSSFISAARTSYVSKFFDTLFAVREVAVPVEKHESSKPDWLSFACVMLKRELIQSIGLMDERFFMYYEDNDYCRRALRAGWKLKYQENARVVHLNNGSSNQFESKALPSFYYRARSYYLIKYYGHLGLFLSNVLWYPGRFISLLKEVVLRVSSPQPHIPNYWKDIWQGFSIRLDKYET